MQADWVRPGTHVVCVGTDTKGKQEVETCLVAKAQLFCDEKVQAVSIGECQHVFAEGKITDNDLTLIGAIISGKHAGRKTTDLITLFDSTGVGLLDLVTAQLALELMEK